MNKDKKKVVEFVSEDQHDLFHRHLKELYEEEMKVFEVHRRRAKGDYSVACAKDKQSEWDDSFLPNPFIAARREIYYLWRELEGRAKEWGETRGFSPGFYALKDVYENWAQYRDEVEGLDESTGVFYDDAADVLYAVLDFYFGAVFSPHLHDMFYDLRGEVSTMRMNISNFVDNLGISPELALDTLKSLEQNGYIDITFGEGNTYTIRINVQNIVDILPF